MSPSPRTTERKYGEVQACAEKKQRSYGSLGGDLGHIKAEAEQYIRWLEDTNSSLALDPRLGPRPDDVDQQLQETQVRGTGAGAGAGVGVSLGWVGLGSSV